MKPFPILLAALIATAATAQTVPPDALAPEPPAADSDVADAQAQSGFDAWLSSFRAAAQAQGVRPETLEAALTGLRYSPRVVALDRSQPDDSGLASAARFSDYLARRLEPVREGRGQATKARYVAKLSELEAATGVPHEIVLGIWGMESSYGAVTGNFDVLRSLASLAYDGRRRVLFTKELTAALMLIDRGIASRDQLHGSWAGAMGQPQFLPSSLLAFGADGDGDGRVDIWGSGNDVAASVSRYLSVKGWRRGQGWGVAVQVPPAFDRERVRDLVAPADCVRVLSKHSRWIALGEWRRLGMTRADGNPWPGDDTLATLVEPDGPGGPAYLTFGNYRRLLDYNCSNFYALSVALLGDALK